MAAVVLNGQTFVGIRSTVPTSDFQWYNLTTGENYPTDTCSVTVNNLGQNIAVQVLTTGGEVWEQACTVIPGTPPTLDCSTVWTPLLPFPQSLRAPVHGHQPLRTAPGRPADGRKTAR